MFTLIFQYITELFVSNSDTMMANPLLIGAAIQGAIGLGTSIYGGIKEGQERKRMEAERAAWNQDNKNWYNQEYYKDFTDRLDTQNTMRLMREEADRQAKLAEGRQIVTGGTNDQALAELENRTKATSNMIANLGATDAQRKDKLTDAFRNRQHQINALNYQTMGDRAEGFGTLASNGIKSIGNIDWASIVKGVQVGGTEEEKK